MKDFIWENLEHVIKEIEGDFGDISFITFLNFVCMGKFIRQVDGPNREIVQLMVSESMLKQLMIRFERVSVKSQSYIIKFFNTYRKDIIQYLGPEIHKKYLD